MTYFISNGKNVKIGFSNDPRSRVKELQTASDSKLILLHTEQNKDDLTRERELHLEFSNDHIIGEWFRPSKELVSFLNERLTNKYIKVIENKIYVFKKMKA